jgi:hypothetical protein
MSRTFVLHESKRAQRRRDARATVVVCGMAHGEVDLPDLLTIHHGLPGLRVRPGERATDRLDCHVTRRLAPGAGQHHVPDFLELDDWIVGTL